MSVGTYKIRYYFQKLQDLDDELKEKYLEIINRFYLLFENIYQYIVDLNSFVDQLNDNTFIQQNIETVLKDVEGKQLLVSNPYLFEDLLFTNVRIFLTGIYY